MSASGRKPDISGTHSNVRYVPQADIRVLQTVGVQTFRPELAVECFDEALVGRLAGPRVVERDIVCIGPEVEIARDEFAAILDANGCGWVARPAASTSRRSDMVVCGAKSGSKSENRSRQRRNAGGTGNCKAMRDDLAIGLCRAYRQASQRWTVQLLFADSRRPVPPTDGYQRLKSTRTRATGNGPLNTFAVLTMRRPSADSFSVSRKRTRFRRSPGSRSTR